MCIVALDATRNGLITHKTAIIIIVRNTLIGRHLVNDQNMSITAAVCVFTCFAANDMSASAPVPSSAARCFSLYFCDGDGIHVCVCGYYCFSFGTKSVRAKKTTVKATVLRPT